MNIISTLIKKLNTISSINALETGTIRSYIEKHESTRIIGEELEKINTTSKLISVDIEPKSIVISKDICKKLNNIEWIQGDSIEVLSNLNKSKDKKQFEFILLDSVNDGTHIYNEFKIAMSLSLVASL